MARSISFAPAPTEDLGQRIAQHRNRRGWTQEQLAERLAASRTAVSQFEAGLALPSERTIVLLAGLFHVEPQSLVEGTNYPAAKAERLPHTALRYTEAEMQLALLRRDLAWAARLHDGQPPGTLTADLLEPWVARLESLAEATSDGDSAELAELRAALRAALAS
jgi:transcriptional regulator with XRE-family HTH domain